MKESTLYSDLIGNPYAPNKYRALARYYESIGRQNEADAFWHAINIKFTYESNNSSTDQEPRSDSN